MNQFFLKLALSGGVIMAGVTAQGALIVDFGGTDYVTSNTAQQVGGFDVNGDPLPISPAGLTGSSATFYGHNLGTGFTVDNNAAGDRIAFRPDDNTVSEHVILWKANSLSSSTTAFTFDADSTITMNRNSFSSSGIFVRYVIRNSDGDYFASTSTGNLGRGTGPETFNPTTVSWFAYDPASDLVDLVPPVANAAGAAGFFENLTEVGYLVNFDGTGINAVRFDSFEVDAVAVVSDVDDVPDAGGVPEPASLLMFGLGACVIACRRSKA